MGPLVICNMMEGTANHRVAVQNNTKYRDASRVIELFPVYVCGRNAAGNGSKMGPSSPDRPKTDKALYYVSL
jgi:hypothetical protein